MSFLISPFCGLQESKTLGGFQDLLQALICSDRTGDESNYEFASLFEENLEVRG